MNRALAHDRFYHPHPHLRGAGDNEQPITKVLSYTATRNLTSSGHQGSEWDRCPGEQDGLTLRCPVGTLVKVGQMLKADLSVGALSRAQQMFKANLSVGILITLFRAKLLYAGAKQGHNLHMAQACPSAAPTIWHNASCLSLFMLVYKLPLTTPAQGCVMGKMYV